MAQWAVFAAPRCWTALTTPLRASPINQGLSLAVVGQQNQLRKNRRSFTAYSGNQKQQQQLLPAASLPYRPLTATSSLFPAWPSSVVFGRHFSSSLPEEEPEKKDKPSLAKRFKQMYKNYW